MSKNTNSNKVSELQLSFQIDTPAETTTAKPFLKWAGGKGQLIEQLSNLLPSEFKKGDIKKYVEPFIGGGAFFFFIAQSYSEIEEFYISDLNQELILAYRTIQKDAESLVAFLSNLEKNYHKKDREAQKEYFYQVRNDFNEKLNGIDFENFQNNWIERTGEIIFLNRTCFNGLFRVNSKGYFNVPFGDYKNPKICDVENLIAISKLLQRTEISFGDFTANTNVIDKNTFVYFDPPYRPLSSTASFTSYSKFNFDDEAQRRLAKYFRDLDSKGASLMLSNSDPKNVEPNDDFFEDIYKGFNIQRVGASRMINSKASGRGKITELVITNYGVNSKNSQAWEHSMKFLDIYKTKYGLTNEEEVFNFLTTNLTDWIQVLGLFCKLEQGKKES